MSTIRVTIWNEFHHERHNPRAAEIYPNGLHNVLADALRKDPLLEVRTCTLEEPSHGLMDEVIASTDVMLWWGHHLHGAVDDEIVRKVVRRVWDGMGFIALHSAHISKPFMSLMGTECMLRWRDKGEREIIWTIEPGHPIVTGVPDRIEIPRAEMYGEWFQIPTPDSIVFISSFEGGEVFRSGCIWKRGKGRVFYFRPGHETFPIYYIPEIQRIIRNGVYFCAKREVT